ncbi:MAG: phage/plasmid primase, P4 family [Clostridium sp.]|nr:hypothetical protein [Clostridium sp.]
MILKTAKQIIMEYIKDLVIIKECPEGLYTVSSLLKRLKESGDKEACLMLKYHCDIIDKNLFSSIIGSLLPGIRIEEGISDNQYDLRHNEGLIEELRILINHNKAISLGFFYDEKKKLRLNPNRCISYLQQILKCVIKNGSLMVLNQKEGVYEEFTDELIGTILRYLMNSNLPDSWKKYYEKDILDGLLREVPRVDSEIIDDSLIALNNGVFNMNTMELVPYDESHIFTSKSPVNFIKGASCPQFIKAMREIVCNDEELLMCIQEIFGYTLINNTKGERAFYFVGVGSNGKSFTAEILTKIVGKKNVSNIQLSNFSEKFGIEGIVGMTLNIANENEVGSIKSTENLKAIISGDSINISRKFKKAINYKPTVKLVFLLNTLPDTLDNTHGYYRKILIVPFNRVFKQEEMDKNLKDKVSEELSGILNWAIEGAKRLMNNDYKFTECEVIKKAIKDYKEEQNPVEAFSKDALIYEEGHSETKKDILDAYKLWIEGQNISSRGTESPQRFWKALSNSAKVLLDKELEYKKVQGILYLKNFRIDYSKLPAKRDKYTFI